MRRQTAVPNMLLLLLGLIVAAAGTRATIAQEVRDRDLEVAASQVTHLETQLADQQARNEAAAGEAVRAVLGMSPDRMDRDRLLIAGMVEQAFTWDSAADYLATRESLQRRYGLHEQDSFLSEFLPPPNYRQDTEHRRYYGIDAAGLNASPNHPQILPRDVTGTSYEYLVILDVDIAVGTEPVPGTATRTVWATRQVLLEITCDIDGQITHLTAAPAAAITRTSN